MTEQTTDAPAASQARPAVRTHPGVDPAVDLELLVVARESALRGRLAHEAKLARLRLYSYCLTLAACVFALMSFMYLAQGTADGDSTFVTLGAGFVLCTAATLWLAVRVTHVMEFVPAGAVPAPDNP